MGESNSSNSVKASGELLPRSVGSSLLGTGHRSSTHVLVQTGPRLWRLQPHLRTRAYGAGIGIVGVAAVFAPLVIPMPRPPLTIVLGIATIIVGLWWYGKETRTTAVDLDSGWIERSTFRGWLKKPRVHCKDVHAFQVLAARIERGFEILELNVVLTSGKRVHLLSHSKTDEVLANARTLASLLGVPIWNTTEGTRR